MKDATYYIMSEFYRLLNGVISVPVYNSQVDADNTEVAYVVIMPSFDTLGSTKNSFHGNYYINVDISNLVADNAQSWELVNSISNEVLSILCPNPALKALSDSSGFAVIGCRNIRGTMLPILRTDTDLIMRKILEFEIFISNK